MGKAAAVSFEGDVVRIVHASLKGRSISVEKTETVTDGDFDNYLRREKTKEFIVTCEFRESYQDVISTPVVKQQYLEKIVESEIRKTAAQKDFSFIYTVIGEKVIENKKVLEVFYYAVTKEALKAVADRFYNNGKLVKAVYPSVFSAAALFDNATTGEAQMGLFGAGKGRTVFFTKKGAVHFIRNYESFEAEFSDFDIQNINMTISYCFQNFRTSPSSVFLMGDLSGPFDVNTMPTSPLACLSAADYSGCDRETFNQFVLPVASFLASPKANILCRDFKNVYVLKNYMVWSFRVFMALAALCIGFIIFVSGDVIEKRALISPEKRGRADLDSIYAEFIAKNAKMTEFMPLVDFLNKPVPDFRKLLIGLAGTDMGQLRLDSIKVTAKEENSFSVNLDGSASVDTYSGMQGLMTDFTGALGRIPEIKIENKTVNLEKKTFTIEMSYNTAQ
ncbi:MAG: hypothetical protein C4560_08800 [Nitrospiraceae bacterium]|nr:MAG: hypothetical protein C4560_08800 [Nitrospiraceae bacterium]